MAMVKALMIRVGQPVMGELVDRQEQADINFLVGPHLRQDGLAQQGALLLQFGIALAPLLGLRTAWSACSSASRVSPELPATCSAAVSKVVVAFSGPGVVAAAS